MGLDLLWLPDVSTVSVRGINDVLECKAVFQPPGPQLCSNPLCPGTGRFVGKFEDWLHDAPIRGRGVKIFLTYERHRCSVCNARIPIPFQAGSLKMTKRCLAYIRKQSLLGPASDIAATLSASTSTVERVCRDYKSYLEERYRTYIPKRMGIDEVKIRSAFRYIIIDHEKNQIVDLLKDHTDKTLQNWLHSVPGRNLVELVTMDQTARYRATIKKICPQAAIACDKFHLIRRANQAVSAAYQASYGTKKLSKKQIGYNRSLLWSYREDLNAFRLMELDGLLSNYPILKDAYEFKNAFVTLIMSKHKNPLSAYKIWYNSRFISCYSRFERFLVSCQNWQPQILTMITASETNSTTEGLNKKVKDIVSWSSHCDFEQIRIRVLYNVPSLPNNTCVCCGNVVLPMPVAPLSTSFNGADEQMHCPICVSVLDDHLRVTTVDRHP